MTKFVVAFRDRETSENIASILRDGGFEVIRICVSGDEVKRAFRTIQDGILISGYRLSDQLLDRLAEDLNEHVEILGLVRPEQMKQVSSSRLFLQKLPAQRSELIMWADMLEQLHYQKLPRRKTNDKELINRAKKKVMSERNMSESDAHRYLQQMSMRLGLRISEVAEKIVSSEDE